MPEKINTDFPGFSQTASGNAKWYKHFESNLVTCCEAKFVIFTIGLSIPLLDMYPRVIKTCPHIDIHAYINVA